ncbi:hypothetical protein [Bacillus thuringiensis]|uniref:hypothetical protein n=1 Tax=Bacillus thuringiensis TaxID=1428 RepID=UPI002DBBBFEE|nr:hypothetical protein [Bacillus thuringiensis]MEC3147861.1 hypothetical protein [Bacillus thuringiensis]MED2598052.1 hypothetical protein [Bacillus thuringiensis]
MTQQNNKFMEQADEMLVPFEDEAKATILMSSLMNVFAQNGIDDMEQARMFVMQEIFKMFDNLTYTNLITIYSLTSQLNKNFASVKTRKNTQTNEKTFYTKDEMKRIAKENYNKGVIEGEKSLLNEIKNENYPELVQNLFMKKVEEGYKKANEEHRTIGFQTAYQRGFKEGLEKGKELRIKELRKMREWE